MLSESASTCLSPCRRARRARSSAMNHRDFRRRKTSLRAGRSGMPVVVRPPDVPKRSGEPTGVSRRGHLAVLSSPSSQASRIAVMNVSAPPKFGMGASPLRVEDGSLIRGAGRYTDDVTPQGTLIAYVVRSNVAHAKIKVGGLEEARAAPGVHLVWTAEDVSGLGFMPLLAHGPTELKFETPPFPVLCTDTVRHVGDAIAFIVADDLNSAKSAAELIDVDYDTLPAVIDTAQALDPDAPLVWPDKGSNLACEYTGG